MLPFTRFRVICFLQEAFAVVREASKRVLGLRPFDVQLIGWFGPLLAWILNRTPLCFLSIRWANLQFFWHWWYFTCSCSFVFFIGGMVLHKGEIAEMKTGEGKTLVAILPAFLNALTGKGVHVVTVNDYLARRDCEWVGQVPRFLGLKVGLIQRTFYTSLVYTLLLDRNL